MSAKKALFLILFIDLVVIGAARFIGTNLRFHFQETGYITKFSFIQLIVIGILAFMIYVQRKLSDTKNSINPLKCPYFVWLLIASGFLFLAGDEVFMIHEKIDLRLHTIFHLQENAITDRLDDFIIVVYAMLGALVLWIYKSEITKFKSGLPILALGAGVLAISVIIDIATNREDLLMMFITDWRAAQFAQARLGIIEEALKVLSEGIFIAAFYDFLQTAKLLNRN